VTWTVDNSGPILILQVAALLVGLTWSTNVSLQLASGDGARPESWRQSIPVSFFCLAYTLVMLWLLVG
jgi:hypothetical protein